MPDQSKNSILSSFQERIHPTITYDDLNDFQPVGNSAYLYACSNESRSSYLSSHMSEAGVALTRVTEHHDEFEIDIAGNAYNVSLYSGRQLDSVWQIINCELVYIDITGLSHHIWAPLIASASRQGQNIQVIYVEPADYQRSKDTTQEYDLSEGINGIEPLPGFISLQPTGENICFVPILGFEGARFKYAANKVDPPPNSTYPIIGLPGFRPEYPFETYKRNEDPLSRIDNGQLPHNIYYADASCPFRLFYVLDDIASENTDDIIKIALLGTKPHALGAVLYAMLSERGKVELVYDHPKRKDGRTSGNGRFYIFHVSFFISLEQAFRTQ